MTDITAGGQRYLSSDLPWSVVRPPFFAGLVAFARRQDPIPSRTRPSNALAPMVLCLKTWESRSPPGPPRTEFTDRRRQQRPEMDRAPLCSPVGRRQFCCSQQMTEGVIRRTDPLYPSAALRSFRERFLFTSCQWRRRALGHGIQSRP
jgi:hypothetical protein